MNRKWTLLLMIAAATLLLAAVMPADAHHRPRIDQRIVHPYNVPVLFHIPILAGYEPVPPPQPCGVANESPLPFYSEDFEGAHGWTFTGTPLSQGGGGNLWHTTTLPVAGDDAGHDGPGRLYFGNDASGHFSFGHVAGVAQSPPIALPAVGAAVFSWSEKWNVEWLKGYDHLWVEAVLPSGQIHLLCHANAVDRFDTSSSGDFTGLGSCSPVLTAPCQSQVWLAWMDRSVLIPPVLMGQTVQLRFTFDSADNVANRFMGWMVDDVAVSTVP